MVTTGKHRDYKWLLCYSMGLYAICIVRMQIHVNEWFYFHLGRGWFSNKWDKKNNGNKEMVIIFINILISKSKYPLSLSFFLSLLFGQKYDNTFFPLLQLYLWTYNWNLQYIGQIESTLLMILDILLFLFERMACLVFNIFLN